MNAATTTRRTRRKTDDAIANGAQLPAGAIIPADHDDGNGIPKGEKKHDERFLGISTATLVTAIENAAGFSKSALHLELAVGLLLFANHGKADLAAKKDLAIVYQQAGYKCATPNDEDYKTVNRRINVAAEFFDWLDGADVVKGWITATSEMQSIQAIVRHLEDEFNFKGMNSVMAHIGKPVILKRDRERIRKQVEAASPARTTGEPAGPQPILPEQKSAEGQKQSEKAAEQPTAGQTGVAAALAQKSQETAQAAAKGETLRRRASDKQDTHVIQTAHMRVEVPMNVTKEELIQISTELLMLANTLQVAESGETVIG